MRIGGARKDANRRDLVDDSLADLSQKMEAMNARIDDVARRFEERLEADDER